MRLARTDRDVAPSIVVLALYARRLSPSGRVSVVVCNTVSVWWDIR